MIFKKSGTYDLLKTIALKVLPAIEFLVITIFEIWKLPYGAQIGATIAAIDTALGVFLGISNKKFNNMEIDTDTSAEDEMLLERDDE